MARRLEARNKRLARMGSGKHLFKLDRGPARSKGYRIRLARKDWPVRLDATVTVFGVDPRTGRRQLQQFKLAGGSVLDLAGQPSLFSMVERAWPGLTDETGRRRIYRWPALEVEIEASLDFETDLTVAFF